MVGGVGNFDHAKAGFVLLTIRSNVGQPSAPWIKEVNLLRNWQPLQTPRGKGVVASLEEVFKLLSGFLGFRTH